MTACQYKKVRSGCHDMWNAFMCHGASYSVNDIPYCPTTAESLPESIITWDEAKHIHKTMPRGEVNESYVCFYMDDYKFDGSKGIWHNYKYALKVLGRFSGVITPDFSTYQDFPMPIKIYNTYRMRAFGYWLGKNGVHVINNVRWGSPESYQYCFDGILENSIVAIGTVGGSPKKKKDRRCFEDGLFKMVDMLHPKTIVVYGSASYPCFDRVKNLGVAIVPYPSKTALYFKGKSLNE